MTPTPAELRKDKLAALAFAMDDLHCGNIAGFRFWWDYAKCCLFSDARRAQPETPATVIFFCRFAPDMEAKYLRHLAWNLHTSTHTLLLAHVPVYPWNMPPHLSYRT